MNREVVFIRQAGGKKLWIAYNLKGLKEMAEITGDELTKLDFKIKTFEFENAGPTSQHKPISQLCNFVRNF